MIASLPWNIFETLMKWSNIYQDAPWSVEIQHESLQHWGFSFTPTEEEEEEFWYQYETILIVEIISKPFNMFSLFFHPISVGGQAKN